MKEKNGGSAFPVSFAYAYEDKNIFLSGGMTLRDYFAAKAMQGFAADPQVEAGAEKVAQIAYAWADAMLAARESTP